MHIRTIMRSICIAISLLASTDCLDVFAAAQVRLAPAPARPESRFSPGDKAIVVRSKTKFKFGSQTIALLEPGAEMTVGSIGPGWIAGYVNINGTRKSGYLNTSDIVPATNVANKAVNKNDPHASLAGNRPSTTPTRVVIDSQTVKQAQEHLERALAYDHIGDRVRALAGYNEALRLDPNCVQAYSNRGTLFFKNGDWNHAIADFTEAIRLDPKSAVNFVDRAAAYNQKGNYDLAIADCTEALRLDPRLVLAYAVRGVSYKNKGDFDRAIADCEQAIRLDPQNARAYYCCGLARASKGDHIKADENFAAARKLGYRPTKAGE